MSAEVDQGVAAHYTVAGMLDGIREALRDAGIDRPTVADLGPYDQLHTGGAEATGMFLTALEIRPGMQVLDIGCGIGGPARHVAAECGARVTGVDLTPGFIETAQALSALCGMGDATRFLVGSALDLPVPDDSTDLALMIHVGMNVPDKAGLMAEAARVLKPGGTFALFDVMKTSDAPLAFPFPWAEVSDYSFVAPPETYRRCAAMAGFTAVAETDRRAFAVEFFTRAIARMHSPGGAPPEVARLMMRRTGPQKIENYLTHARAGDISPVEMIFSLPD